MAGDPPPGRHGLYAVVMEAFTGGIFTRMVETLVEDLGGASGIFKSEVSRILLGFDTDLTRLMVHACFTYDYLDATYIHGRLGRNLQVVLRAVVVAIAFNALGYQELLENAMEDSKE